jgi:hypothetical protein
MDAVTFTDTAERGFPRAAAAAVAPPSCLEERVSRGEAWWLTGGALFNRAFPGLSQRLYDILGEDGSYVLDE